MKNEPEELEQQQGWGWGEGSVRMEESASFGAEYKVLPHLLSSFSPP